MLDRQCAPQFELYDRVWRSRCVFALRMIFLFLYRYLFLVLLFARYRSIFRV